MDMHLLFHVENESLCMHVYGKGRGETYSHSPLVFLHCDIIKTAKKTIFNSFLTGGVIWH